MGKPEMYTAQLRVEADGQVSDAASVPFGIREVTSQLTKKGYRLFKINGRNLLIRGAAWAPDMLLRWSPERAQAAIDYVRDMNLNAIRLEGRMERDEFFDLADRQGVLIMPGWTLRFPIRPCVCAATRACSSGFTAATMRRRRKSKLSTCRF
jgi:exo-1,4-beta-D-glucosaminidase